jgi:hypothetical protein
VGGGNKIIQMRNKKLIDVPIINFIESYPLYTKFEVSEFLEAEDIDNIRINLFCKKENKNQTFKLEATSDEMANKGRMFTSTLAPDYIAAEEIVDFTENYIGLCQSCEDYKINVIINGFTEYDKKTGKKFYLKKIGQLPAPEMKIPREILDFLNEDDRQFYSKALKNLEFGYGIGAFAYFRRIIENEIEKIIEDISKIESPDSKKIVGALTLYNKNHQMSKLIQEITPYLPKNLKEQGENILLLLYGATSIGLHELSEEECVEKSRHIDTLFKFLIKKLNEEKNELSSIKEAIKGLK